MLKTLATKLTMFIGVPLLKQQRKFMQRAIDELKSEQDKQILANTAPAAPAWTDEYLERKLQISKYEKWCRETDQLLWRVELEYHKK